MVRENQGNLCRRHAIRMIIIIIIIIIIITNPVCNAIFQIVIEILSTSRVEY